ncbi:MAG: O-antigen ligase family protein [Aggregatilineales bacterium]
MSILNNQAPDVAPRPGVARLLIVVAVCLAITITGISAAVVANRQHTQIARGWRDATAVSDLPVRGALAGVNVELTQYNSAKLNSTLDQIAAVGITWIRQPFLWSDIEAAQGVFDFSKYDPIVAAVAAHPTLKLIAVLNDTPVWARHAGAKGNSTAPPASPGQFGNFAGQIAAHYAGKIADYQVWDEPNLSAQWGELDPSPADYLAILRAAYPAIHAAVPDVTVIAAALAPTVEQGPHNISDLDYLHGLYALGGKSYFDAAAAKPYGFNTGPFDRTVNPNVLNFSRIILLREEMERQRDGAKPIWASDFGWNSLPADWKGKPSIWGQVDAATQEAYTRQAYQRAAQEWPWLAGLIIEHWQPAAPVDAPIQGFTIADRAAQWAKDGVFVASGDSASGLNSGVHPLTDPRVQYTGAWRTGPLGADVQQNADNSAFSVPIDGGSGGESVALSVRRADYVAYLYVTIDGQPANSLPRDPTDQAYLLLTALDRQPHTDLIQVAHDLPPGTHTLAVRAYLGYDRWELAGIAVGISPATHDADVLFAGGLLVTLIGLVGTITFSRMLPWQRLTTWRPTVIGYIRRMSGIGATIAVSAVTMVGLLLTFGGALPNVFRRDPPTLLLTALTAGLIYFSPVFLVTVISAVVLFLILYNRPSYGLALTIFWAPFFLFPVELYLTAAPMVEVSLAITAAAIILRTVLTWIGKRDRKFPTVHLRPMDWVMLAFVAVAVLTLAWSEQRAPALRELRTMVLEPALFYALLRLTPLDRRDVLRIVDILLIAGMVVCVIGFAQYFHIAGTSGVVIAEQGSERLASVYGSPNNVALFLGRCVPFAFAFALFPLSRPRRIAAGIVAAVMIVAVLLTQSVGGLALGIPAGIVVVLLAWKPRVGGAIAIGLGALGTLALVILPRFVPRFAGLFNGTRESSFVRTELWQSTFSLLRERPITGAGLDQFLYLYRSRYILPDAYREPDLSHPHNFFLDYWVSLGIAGVAILIALQITFWSYAFHTYRRVRQTEPLLAALCVGAMGSMADFLAHGLVDNSYFVVDLSFVFCLTMALVAWLRREAEAMPIQSELPGTVMKVGLR